MPRLPAPGGVTRPTPGLLPQACSRAAATLAPRGPASPFGSGPQLPWKLRPVRPVSPQPSPHLRLRARPQPARHCSRPPRSPGTRRGAAARPVGAGGASPRAAVEGSSPSPSRSSPPHSRDPRRLWGRRGLRQLGEPHGERELSDPARLRRQVRRAGPGSWGRRRCRAWPSARAPPRLRRPGLALGPRAGRGERCRGAGLAQGLGSPLHLAVCYGP